MPVVTLPSGKRFEIASGQTLLDAGLSAGVALPYSCRSGRCSTCKGRVVAGSTLAVHDEIGLEAGESEQGWVLTCVRHASSDVELAIDDLSAWPLAAPRLLPCRIQALDRPAADVVVAVLRLPPGNELAFRPGQYVDVVGPGGLRRSYSIANAPRADRTLELHVRQVPGGAMSRYWFEQAAAGDLLRLHGPLGTFFLREVDGVDLVFLATGTGIAPVKAMLESLAGDEPPLRPRSVEVLWGGRTEPDLYHRLHLPAAAARYVPVLSRAEAGWHGERGHVQDALLRRPRDWARTAVYACGSDAMIHAAQARLVAAGLDPRHFHSDAFVSSGSA